MFTLKLKKAFLHLIISSIIITLLLGIIFFIWYPSPFLKSSGLTDILYILLAIDLILGPILTFIVYKPNKPSLKYDLLVIITLQLSALAYGVYTIHKGHPVFIAYTVDRFTLINFNDIDLAKVTNPALQTTGLWKPKFVYVDLPKDPKKLSELTLEVLSGKPDIDARPEYYQSFEDYKDHILQGGIAPQKLRVENKNQKLLDEFIKVHGKQVENYAFLPFAGKNIDLVWVWDRASKEPIGTLAIDPWSL